MWSGRGGPTQEIQHAPIASAVPECKTGKACGDTCIAKDRICHIPKPAKECKIGKLCGDSCISKEKVCHK
jgi:hypothetical protein